MSTARKTLLVTVHGGGAGTINTVRAFPDVGPSYDLLVDSPPMKELRKFLFDATVEHLYIANAAKDHSRILVFTPDAAKTKWQFESEFTPDGLSHPFDIAFGFGGDLFVSNQDTNRVTRYTTAGKQIETVPFVFKAVRGLAYDDEYLYVADSGTEPGYVAAFDEQWNKHWIPVEQPVHLLWDAAHRRLFIGSESENSVLVWNPADRAAPPLAVIPSGESPIDHTAGVALEYGPVGYATLYVASRVGKKIFSFPLDFTRRTPQWKPRTATEVLKPGELKEEPEFVGIAGGAYG
jgi:hypothetical protein